MNQKTKRILVTGATGVQGGAVANELLKQGHTVIALTRNLESNPALKLKESGATLIQGDFENRDSLKVACGGVDGVFSVQDFYAPNVGYDGEIRQASNLIQAAEESNVSFFIQSAMGDAKSYSGVPHFESKKEIEKRVKDSALSWTILGTVWFIDNLTDERKKPRLTFPVLNGGLCKDTKFPILSVRDLAKVTALISNEPEKYRNTKINLANELITVEEMMNTYELIAGKKARRWKMPSWFFRMIAPEFSAQLKWHNRINFSFDESELTELLNSTSDSLKSYITRHEIDFL